MAISDILFEGGLTFKTYLDKEGEKGGGGVKIKSENLRGDVIYIWPPIINLENRHTSFITHYYTRL